MATIGIAWLITASWGAVWQAAEMRRSFCVAALILLIGSTAGVASYRAYWWRQAGDEMERAIAWMDASLADIPSGATVWVTRLPDKLHHAYVFRNAFPTLAHVRFPDHIVHGFLDIEGDAAQLPVRRPRPHRIPHGFLDIEGDAAQQDERCAHAYVVRYK